MKKILSILGLLCLVLIPSVKAISNACLVNLYIDGEGEVFDIDNNKSYVNSSNFILECGNGFNFSVIPKSKYIIESVYWQNNGTDNKIDLKEENSSFKINEITSDISLYVNLRRNDKYEVINDGNISLKYYPDLNRIEYVGDRLNVEINLPNIANYITDKTELALALDEYNFTFSKGFLNINKNNKIKISINEVSDSVLSEEQLNAIKDAKHYEINLWIQNEKQKVVDTGFYVSVPYTMNNEAMPLVYHIDNDGQYSEESASYRDGKIIFNTKKLVLFAVKSVSVSAEKTTEEAITDKVDQAINYIGSLNFNTVFAIALGVGFVIYLIKDYKKNNKNK